MKDIITSIKICFTIWEERRSDETLSGSRARAWGLCRGRALGWAGAWVADQGFGGLAWQWQPGFGDLGDTESFKSTHIQLPRFLSEQGVRGLLGNKSLTIWKKVCISEFSDSRPLKRGKTHVCDITGSWSRTRFLTEKGLEKSCFCQISSEQFMIFDTIYIFRKKCRIYIFSGL